MSNREFSVHRFVDDGSATREGNESATGDGNRPAIWEEKGSESEWDKSNY